MRRAARVDATQAAVVAALRAAGATVWVLGLPVDLLVGFVGATGRQTLLMECKSLTGKRAPKPKRYTDLQLEFLRDWRGGPVVTVTSAEEALAALAQG
jgi:hypothetical protein